MIPANGWQSVRRAVDHQLGGGLWSIGEEPKHVMRVGCENVGGGGGGDVKLGIGERGGGGPRGGWREFVYR